jgi:hypothetical protein
MKGLKNHPFKIEHKGDLLTGDVGVFFNDVDEDEDKQFILELEVKHYDGITDTIYC